MTWISTALVRDSSKQLQRRVRTRTTWDPADKEPPGVKRKPKVSAVTIPSVAQPEQAPRRTRSAKQ